MRNKKLRPLSSAVLVISFVMLSRSQMIHHVRVVPVVTCQL